MGPRIAGVGSVVALPTITSLETMLWKLQFCEYWVALTLAPSFSAFVPTRSVLPPYW